MVLSPNLKELRGKLEGELYFDDLIKSIYATDASVYRKLPLAVSYPKNTEDLKQLINFARANKTSLIPRTAGTSLAGQCVGDGILVDVSKYFTKIIELNEKAQTVTVQPGVVRDALNNYLKPFGLFFGPNTSTSNRCMIGGMVGNNSSGTTSIQYGVTRNKVLELDVVLSDGSQVTFGEITKNEFHDKLKEDTLEGRIYKTIYEELKSESVQKQIIEHFPKPEIHRRNTGYAIDELIANDVFTGVKENFNMCKLLSGSEGTLAFTTQITLELDKLPPQESIMVAAHFESIENCMKAVEPLMQHNLYTCEMMDKTILDCTKHNKTQQENRQFIVGDPKAILMCEVKADSLDDVNLLAENLLKTIKTSGLSYAFPKLVGNTINKALELRSAGLGLLGNIIGDKKGVACIEDTAVALPDLANYISEFTQLMKNYKQDAIYYAHAGAGEIHLRPILNLKNGEDVDLFRKITTDVAHLVKSYKGSMSGEHGDGLVRSEFIPLMIGDENYQILKKIKATFDTDNIFNPGKIVDALPMDKGLRYKMDRAEPQIETFLDFSKSQGILREAEKCNGSGDCRKLPEFGGTMCPSYRATRNEKDTTRARANALREFLTNSEKSNKFNHAALKDVFDLCLSCKACASECPSSVDVASLKAEFQYQYQKENGVSLRTKLFAYNNKFNQIGSKVPRLINFVFSNGFTSALLKKSFGIAKERSLPLISNKSLYKQFQSFDNKLVNNKINKTVYLFNDEFTNHLDTSIGLDAIQLLNALNYDVKLIDNAESGRSFLSKGLLKQAKDSANKNTSIFKDKISEDTPLIGLEPSAILTFKDEYLKLADDKISAEAISKHTFLIEEFIKQEIELGHIKPEQFTLEAKTIKFHGHCHQKAMSNQLSSFAVLNLPKNYKVTIIPSGCCGMAGSFGYEKEHYEVSMQIGEQTLFPAIRKASNDILIAANGTSCRHQIKDGTQRIAKHPVTILKDALV
ncbi:MAG: FAD-linked oxidase C-terminal domain-containing protein [Algibacter sp.]|uniref:FAD-binding and (Fe-S)-binding domain-containing protein n=1 Tax=Algibacter sp. TaxID=1872428 RepID=UPI002636FCBC|nr:FAD-binding and (Fe-S)-binding domain-containing protein [Algibacter sp.]MDG1730088.1 FAD-linked oxidase C-terminal domain-containing protein [Algibacter sp.]MDG2179830.1 FAD-linked oxidase C-terminal domain-containing protein [Algibacter sp.]